MHANENGDLVLPELTAEFIGKQKYVGRNLVIKVLDENISKYSTQLAAAITALIEIYVENVEGFDNNLHFNSYQPSKPFHECRPHFRAKEIFGKAITSTIHRLVTLKNKFQFNDDLFTFIAIEPDLTRTQVVDAWIFKVSAVASFEGPRSFLDKTVPFPDDVVYCGFSFNGSVKPMMANYDISGNNPVLDKAKEVLSGMSMQGANPYSGMGSVLGFAQRVVENNKQILAAAEGNSQSDA